MKYTLHIKADHNDADYITSMNIIDEKTLSLVKKVCKIIRNTKVKWGQNWSTSEYSDAQHPTELYKDVLTEDEIDEFNDLVPFGQHGVHTINEIKYAPKVNWKKVL